MPALDLGWKRAHHLVILTFLKHAVAGEVTRSIPVEVAPNTVPGKSLNACKPRFSPSRQYVKGGFSSSYEPMSHTRSAPSVLDSISLLKLLGSDNVVRQDSYSWSPQDGSGLQGVSAPLASTPVRGGRSNSLSILSQSSSRSTPDSVKSLSPFDVSGLPTSEQSSSNMFTVSSRPLWPSIGRSLFSFLPLDPQEVPVVSLLLLIRAALGHN
ncbi:hypothetical protein G5714_012320 [Onychostoma macrolepis]|uniref:Uncharacterized protein n=1 Tax=Onychostoma macrolepis TaxID=369639 RepID=A0A7J6CGF7_9TELE|nr:hypothetical protein G5714_012320 [Onychostoma macrolepis]